MSKEEASVKPVNSAGARKWPECAARGAANGELEGWFWKERGDPRAMSFLHIRSEPSNCKTGINTKTENTDEPFSSCLVVRAHTGALTSPRGLSMVSRVLAPSDSIVDDAGQQPLISMAYLDSPKTNVSRRTRANKKRTVISQF